MEDTFEFDIKNKVDKDLVYIQNEIISKQIDGNFCKWSRPLNAISIIGLTPKQFFEYWEKQYKNYPEYLEIILKACLDKLTNGLTPNDTMINMILNSNDFESEKMRAIKLLGGKYGK